MWLNSLRIDIKLAGGKVSGASALFSGEHNSSFIHSETLQRPKQVVVPGVVSTRCPHVLQFPHVGDSMQVVESTPGIYNKGRAPYV